MELSLNFYRGFVLVSTPDESPSGIIAEGTIRGLAREFSRHYRGLLHPGSVSRPKGVKRGFSFHWSNAQAAWDVIVLSDQTTGLDGAEFLVYFRPDALSPVGKPWSLKEMQYVASILPPHPGYAFSMEGGMGRSAARVAARFVGAGS